MKLKKPKIKLVPIPIGTTEVIVKVPESFPDGNLPTVFEKLQSINKDINWIIIRDPTILEFRGI